MPELKVAESFFDAARVFYEVSELRRYSRNEKTL